MTRVHRFLLLAMFVTGVCASVPADAKSLVLEEFFRGKTVGKGVFESRIAGVYRPFTVTLTGTWNSKTLRSGFARISSTKTANVIPRPGSSRRLPKTDTSAREPTFWVRQTFVRMKTETFVSPTSRAWRLRTGHCCFVLTTR